MDEGGEGPVILAIETSTALLGVALVQGQRIAFQKSLVKPRAHSSMLLPMCIEALQTTGFQVSDLGAVAVSAGPGSFTGLRIGFATAQGLARAARASVIPVPTLDVLLEGCASCQRVAIVQGKARAQTVTALYGRSGDGLIEIIPPAARGMDEFLQEMKSLDPGIIHVTGDAALEFASYCQERSETLPSGLMVAPVTPEKRLPSPATLGFLAARMLEEGKAVKPEEALPRYYRTSSAELTARAGGFRERGRDAGLTKTLEKDAEIDIEKMTVHDLDRVLEIEAQSYRTPWSRRAFTSEIAENNYAHYFVARHKGRIVGYVGMWVILDESHITNIAVDPAYRRQKVARRLLEDMFRRAKDLGASRMTLEVRVSNTGAQDLYKKLGFQDRGRRKGYYTDTNEDAIIMWKDDLGVQKPKEDQVKWMV